jgi:hypothetical protein
MCRLLIKRPFFAIDRIAFQRECEFFPEGREFSHLARSTA